MPLPSKNNFLEHVRWLRAAVKAQGAELLLVGDSLEALVRHAGRHWALYPQFLAMSESVSRYVPVLTDDSIQFAGWLPYRNRRWPAASDKLVFKRYAQQAGLTVPAWSPDSASGLGDVVVKRAVSSFGVDVRGPLRAGSQVTLDVAQGEYLEQFVSGSLMKLWYWNGVAVAAEVDAMPRVVGDGRTALDELIRRRMQLIRRQPPAVIARQLERSAEVLAWQGKSLADVLPAGAEQLVEFRYGSELTRPRDRRVVDPQARDDDAWRSVRSAGPVLQQAIAPALRGDTLFTVDAVRDAGQRVWLLEMNSNPMVHPLAYPAMVATLLASDAGSPAGSAPPRVPASV